MDDSHDITGLLIAGREGDAEAFDRLMPLVYDALRGIARRQMALERADHTLDTTGLVHEVYLKLVDQTRVEWRDRAHFYAVAAQAMRRILVDYARRHRAAKRGGKLPLLDDIDVDSIPASTRADRLIALDEALTQLAELNPRLVQVVEYRFFAGLTEEEVAQSLGMTERTVRRDWVKARGWLYRELAGVGA